MENVASKIKALNFPEETYPTIPKFILSLSDECVTLEELVRIVNYLYEKGISLRPSQIKVLANGFSYIEKTVDEMERLGELDAFIEDPNRINSKDVLNRLKYLKSIHAEYKKDGKYAKALFSKRIFKAQYGEIDFAALDLDSLNLSDASNAQTYYNEDFAAYQSEEISPLAFSDEKEDTIVVNPVWPELDTSVRDAYGTVSEERAEDYDPASLLSEEVGEGTAYYDDIKKNMDKHSAETDPYQDEYAPIPYIASEDLENPQIVYAFADSYQDDYQSGQQESMLASDDALSKASEDVQEDSKASNLEGLSPEETNGFAEIEAAFNDADSKESITEEKAPKTQVDLTNSAVSTSFSNPYEEILSKPQTIGLNDETFERYEKLAENIRHVLVSVYNIDEVNDTITDNLIKLITNGVEKDSEVIYYAITFGKMISEEEAQRLRSAIEEELEYTNILDINLEVAA